LGVEGMERSYRPTAYLGFGRVYFNIAASDAPEPLSPFAECAVGSFDMSDRHQKAPRPTWLPDRGCPDSLFQHACAPGDLRHDRARIAPLSLPKTKSARIGGATRQDRLRDYVSKPLDLSIVRCIFRKNAPEVAH
jgi:hypothetical protein